MLSRHSAAVLVAILLYASVLGACGGGGGSAAAPGSSSGIASASSSSTPSSFNFSIAPSFTTPLSSFDPIEILFEASEPLDSVSVDQLAGDSVIFQTVTKSVFQARVPVVYDEQTVTLQFVGRSESGVEVARRIDVLVQPLEFGSFRLDEESIYQLRAGRDDYKTDKFAVFEFPVYSVIERGSYSGPYCYPDPENCDGSDGGIFLPLLAMATGDFNGDGHEDVAVSVTIYPEFYRPEGRISIIYGRGDGTMDPNVQEFLNVITPYRIEVQDFNGDGIDDIWVPNGGFDEISENGFAVGMRHAPLFMAYGGREGAVDASDRIDDDFSVRQPLTHTGCSGDITGDGFPETVGFDAVFENDGAGRLVPVNMRERFPEYEGNHTCHIDDLDGDGIGDLIMNTTPGQSENTVQIMFSSDHPDWTQRQLVGYRYDIFDDDKVSVPSGNDVITLDADQDGDKDIVIAFTRGKPYYRGRKLIILINHGERRFVDETETRFPIQFREDGVDLEEELGVGIGEGNLFAVDFDNDGCVDIYDTLGAPTDEGLGDRYYVGIARTLPIMNDCSGNFSHLSPEVFPSGVVSHNKSVPLDVGIPVNLDNQGALDLIVMTDLDGSVDNEVGARLFYTVINTAPLEP